MTVILLLVVLALHAAVVSAGQFQGQGHVWAEQICLSTGGLCQQPFLMGFSAGLITTGYFLAVVLFGRDRGMD
jgi:hypothetical protein